MKLKNDKLLTDKSLWVKLNLLPSLQPKRLNKIFQINIQEL